MKTGLPAKKEDRRYTYADYRTWPDDERWELIEGTAYNMSPALSYGHQEILSRLFSIVSAYLKGKACKAYFAPVDVLLPGGPVKDEDEVDTVVQPDLIIICDRKKVSKRFCTGAPDLAVEILSPSTALKDIRIKSSLYEKHGVKEYWIVDPGNRTVHLFTLAEGRYGDPRTFAYDDGKDAVCASTAFPGLGFTPASLFDDLWA